MLRNDPTLDVKQQLATALLSLLRGSTASQIYFWIQLDQPRLSDLRRGKLKRFSVDRLLRLIAATGHRVELQVVKAPIVRRARGTGAP